MQIIDIPVFNQDGSIQYTQRISPEEAKGILQFALNFLVTSGLVANYAVMTPTDDQPDLFDVGSDNPQ